MSTFIEKVKPLLFSEDVVLRHAWLMQLHDYPKVPVTLVNELVEFCEHHPETRKELFIQLENSPKNEETLILLARWVREVPFQQHHLVVRFLLNVTPALMVQFKDDFMYFIGIKYIASCEQILALEQTAEQEFEPLWELYGEFCYNVENDSTYQNWALLQHVLNSLIRLGEYDANEARMVIADEIDHSYFTTNAMMAVYAAGVMQLEECIPQFVELLQRDLQDEFSPILETAMIQLQSDRLIEAIAPYVINAKNGMFITVNIVLKEAKSELAEQILCDAYERAIEVDMKEFLLDALICSYSEKAFPYIDDFLAQGKRARAFDMDQLFYSYYKAMGKEHVLLETWRADILEREQREHFHVNDLKFLMREHLGKIGRNDPCVCGSGKKFKKCCGKGL